MNRSKVIGIGVAAALSIALLAGCAPGGNGDPGASTENPHTAAPLGDEISGTQTPAKTELDTGVRFQDGQKYAVAYLGFQKIEDWAYYQALYALPDEPPTYWISDGDFYLVIPRYTNTSVTIDKVDFNTSARTLSHTIQNAGPFVVQCNVSDIFADTVITLTHEGTSVECSPFLSLRDGSLQLAPEALNITDPGMLPSAERQADLGTYTAADGSSLTIGLNEDGKYTVDLSIVRLTRLEDGIGSYEDGRIQFTATDANGNPISGAIDLEDGVAAVTITESTWNYLPNGEVFRFGRDVGTYAAPDGSTLTIGINENGIYTVGMSIVRLTDLKDGFGTYANGRICFAATDADGNPITGEITVTDGAAEVAITDSDWSYLPEGETLRFGKGVGSYSDADGSTLTIGLDEDGIYTVDLSIVRLVHLADGVGTYENGVLRFVATDPTGSPITGEITLAIGATDVTITESAWDLLPVGTAMTFTQNAAA